MVDLLENLEKRASFSISERTLILNSFRKREIKRGEFLLKRGDLCPYIFFVESGALRSFFLNESGKDSTIMFAVHDWWITDMHCFLREIPAMISIQAIQSSSVLELSKKNLEFLLKEVPAFNTFFRKLMENAYCREQLRMIENLSLPAKDRYLNFLEKYPHIIKEVPLKQIASYLGITPEFLSSIRSKLE